MNNPNTGYYLITVSEGGKKLTFASCVDPARALARCCKPGAVLEGCLSISRESYLEYKEHTNPGSTGPKFKGGEPVFAKKAGFKSAGGAK
jgi:hypothetical protein